MTTARVLILSEWRKSCLFVIMQLYLPNKPKNRSRVIHMNILGLSSIGTRQQAVVISGPRPVFILSSYRPIKAVRLDDLLLEAL